MPKRSGKGQMKSVSRGVKKANVSLASIASVLESQQQTLQNITESSAQVQDNQSGGGGAQLIAIQIARAQLQYQKESNQFLKKIRDGQDKQIEGLQKGNKDWKGLGDKFKDLKVKMSDAFDVNTIKKKLLGPFSMFKGARDKMEDLDYMKKAKALGRTDTKQIKADAVASRTAKEDALRAQDKVDRLKRLGANDDEINGSDAMKQRNAALATYNKLNSSPNSKSSKDAANPMGGNVAATSAPLPKTPSDTGGLAQSTTDLAADAQASHENQVEMLRQSSLQTDLLQAIVNNTASKGTNSSAGGSEDKGSGGGGGILGSIGAGLGALGGGLKALGTGAGKGIEGLLKGLARGAAALANPMVIVGLGAFSLTMMAIGKALQWAAPAIEAFAPVLMKVAEVVGDVFIAAIKALPDVIKSVGDVIMGVVGAISDAIVTVLDSVVGSVERLANIDAMNLAGVGAGLLAISGGLIAFAGANLATGLSNLVTGFLGSVSGGSPIDQLERLANMSDGLMSAANGIQAIADAMQGFSNVDPKSMQAINDFPWLKATAFVAAGGAMSAAGAKVYNASKGNADEGAKADAMANKGGGTSVSKTTVQQNNNQTNVGKPTLRNTESSYSKYLSARY